MQQPVTYARIAEYGNGEPDPATATCAQHAVAAPYGEDTNAKGTLVEVDGTDLTCVVCPRENADLIGAKVISYAYDNVKIWGGPPKRDFSVQTEFSLFTGGPAILRCQPEHVAPADTPIPVKDSRVVVIKRSKEELPHVPYVTKAGKWELTLPDQRPAYFDTKREAMADGLRRMAITDFWAARRADEEN